MRAKGPRRKHKAIAKALLRIHDDQVKILVQIWVLKTIIHNNDTRAFRGDKFFGDLGAGNPVYGNNGRRDARQQQGFITHLCNAMPFRINQQRALRTALEAACQKDGIEIKGCGCSAQCESCGGSCLRHP